MSQHENITIFQNQDKCMQCFSFHQGKTLACLVSLLHNNGDVRETLLLNCHNSSKNFIIRSCLVSLNYAVAWFKSRLWPGNECHPTDGQWLSHKRPFLISLTCNFNFVIRALSVRDFLFFSSKSHLDCSKKPHVCEQPPIGEVYAF